MKTASGTQTALLLVVAVACSDADVPRDRPGEQQQSLPEPTRYVVPEPARYFVHEIKDHSFGVIRSRLTVEMTTPETDSARVVEAMMRAALDVHSRHRADVVGVRLWVARPPPPFAVAKKTMDYAPDRCGWTGDDCDRTLWDGVTPREMPEWLRGICPRVMTESCKWLTPDG